MDTPTENDQLILICGPSASGKSASLRNIRNPERWLYLNTEAGKRLPFGNVKFKQAKITDPLTVPAIFETAMKEENAKNIDGIIVDSLTFLMDMYESKYVRTAIDGRSAWGNFQEFFKGLMQDQVIRFNKPIIFIAHTYSEVNPTSGIKETSVPIKGALKNNGIEAYFSCIVYTKALPLGELADYKNDLLNITEEEKLTNLKYVFQTKLTKKTIGDRIRSPMGLWSQQETFIDNDAQNVIDRLNKFYNINPSK